MHQFHEFFEGVLPFTHVLLSVPFYEKKDHSFSAIRQVDWPRQLADLLQFDEKNPAKIRTHATHRAKFAKKVHKLACIGL